MANVKLDKYVPEVKEALDKALAEHLTKVQGKLAKSNPVDSGRMASSWFISQNQPEKGARPKSWAEPGAARVEVSEYPENAIEFDGTWYISNNLPYSERVALNPKWSKGGAGGTAWYTNIVNQQSTDFNKSAAKFLRRI